MGRLGKKRLKVSVAVAAADEYDEHNVGDVDEDMV